MRKLAPIITLLLVALISLVLAIEGEAEVACERMIENKAPRGMLCLHCLHPNAPQGVTPFIELLQKSCLRKPALGFVVDGSFGFDEKRLIEAVQGLAAGGRKGRLHLYIYNGPAQRRWKAQVFNSFAIMDPFLFRHKILKDRKLRLELQARVKMLEPILLYAKAQGVSISIAPGLEDNLGDQSFTAAKKLITKVLPPTVKVKWIRSQCIQCSIGNERFLPKGVALETHTLGTDFSHSGGVVSNDGAQVRFSTEDRRTPAGELVPLISGLLPAIQQATKLNDTYLIWVPKYQDSPYGVVPFAPELRKFSIPTEREQEELLALLKS